MNLLGQTVGDQVVERVFDVCIDPSSGAVMASVEYEGGNFGVVTISAKESKVMPLKGVTNAESILLEHATQPPDFMVETDFGYYGVCVWLTREYGVNVSVDHKSLHAVHEAAGTKSWIVIGHCCRGAAGQRLIDRHPDAVLEDTRDMPT